MEEKITPETNDTEHPQEEIKTNVENTETIEKKEETNNLNKTKKITTVVIKIGAVVIGLVILVIIGVSIYNLINNKPMVIEEKKVEIVPPTEVVNSFYNWYMNYRGNTVETGAYKYNEHLSALFINDIDNRHFKGHLTYDPFVCAPDKPLGVSVISEETKETTSVVKINEDFGTDIQVDVHLVLEGNKWMISQIDCPQIQEQKEQEEQRARTVVTLYFNQMKEGGTDCGDTRSVERTIDEAQDTLTTAVQELFKGPNRAEKLGAYSSPFSEQTEGMLKELRIDGNTAYVNLRDYRNTLELDTCTSKDFINQIEKTIKHYRDVDNIEIAIENSTEDFNSWIKE